MHKCLDYDLNDKLSRDECAEVYPKMWEYVTKLEARIAELEVCLRSFECAYCEEELATPEEGQAHIRKCEKHPLFAANKRIAELEAKIVLLMGETELAKEEGEQ